MQKLIFATNNQHKTEEIRSVLKGRFNIITLAEAGIDIDIPEPFDTLEENAKEKATTIYNLTGISCFGEDTGLETNALNGEPGVKSARYAGEERDFAANIEKLLNRLRGKADRTARFRTVISLMLEGREHRFEGICEGYIAEEPRGEKGFGYDPVFIPLHSNRTFAEMSLAEKNQYSHRGKAMEQLVQFLIKI
ncbi:RdgB/HAM1 family non-canonical purine NTP pyrophosphatase [Agriterribacter sp.]|uniref:RdgB/HAM1 family non-canonical purine NTP pyrophosphatase n=1 Tax=Agriterribacter sp. TaxID=2821509 RepID=UPI002CEEF178|nr:RdgB/HAM1 family non-canonical purine NTP pyrophosphatase [Agriterribacter sp.]HRO45676.1 RdgB/HAM1 family non-canonical purine NTP pyrophosphatase [Agriterribacter sp.]HRQ15846.1 RdgB/HAM1 family non-canonical purine NTP pyrophosphatase [Agriterribacter sp.]